MANKAVALYQHVKVQDKWKLQAAIEPLKALKEGAYYISWYEGRAKRMERVGNNPRQARTALQKKQHELAFVALGGKVQSQSALVRGDMPAPGARKTISGAITSYLERCRAAGEIGVWNGTPLKGSERPNLLQTSCSRSAHFC